MFPSQSLQAMVEVWRDALQSSGELRSYCQANFGKEPKILVGVKLPNAADCPVVMIRPRSKIECAKHFRYVYSILIDWALLDPGETVDGNLVVQPGWSMLDDLGQMILTVLSENGAAYPISRAEYSIDATGLPLMVGKMVAKVIISLTPRNTKRLLDV